MKYCYVVTCDDNISGACYHDFNNAIRFIENRIDKPIKIDEKNPFRWVSAEHLYKIHTLTFDD